MMQAKLLLPTSLLQTTTILYSRLLAQLLQPTSPHRLSLVRPWAENTPVSSLQTILRPLSLLSLLEEAPLVVLSQLLLPQTHMPTQHLMASQHITTRMNADRFCYDNTFCFTLLLVFLFDLAA